MALNPGIELIQEKRMKLLDGLDANEGFEQGLHDSATDQYAGKCHFIYELLQNAGDAGATKVEFTLTEDALEFRHNGTRLFTIDDINSITNYHQSTKKGEDFEAVGKFGMGFKSVFYYTREPEIHSGDYHFRIVRMFYPETSGVRTDEKLNGWTKFLFPFNHSERTVVEIFDEVKQGLLEIRSQTVLFLKKIAEIECLFNDGAYLRITRESEDHLVRIKRTDATSSSNSYYLKFSGQAQMPGSSRIIGLDMAYGLRVSDELRVDAPITSLNLTQFTIEPITGSVFVFFPAEKETSSLQFHINASFATPMSRESLSETPDNAYLLGKLAELVVETLPYLRDHGLLSVETFSVFPNDSDQISSRYEVFTKALVNAFRTQELTPTKMGGYKKADDLIRSENRMSDFLSDEEVSAIYPAYIAPVWVKVPAMLHSRADKFMSLLDLETFSDYDLQNLVVYNDKWGSDEAGKEETNRFKEVLANFDNRRLCELYKRMSKFTLSKYERFCAVFKTKAGNWAHAEDLYFDCDVTSGQENEFLLKVYADDDKEVIDFLRRAGVRNYSFTGILDKHYLSITSLDSPDESVMPLHKNLVRMFIDAVEKEGASATRYSNFKWLCRTNTGALKFASASDIVIDSPYETTGMRFLLKAYPNLSLIDSFYADNFSAAQLAVLKGIFKSFDFVRGIKEHYIEKTGWASVYNHPRESELELPYGSRQRDPWYRDCEIPRIEELVKFIDDDISVRLWRLLTSLKGNGYFKNPFRAIYRHSGACTRTADSLLVCSLMDGKWVKTVDGTWAQPRDVSFAKLHSMYEPREMCDGLRAVKFGEKVKAEERFNLEKQKVVDSFIEEIGATDADEVRTAVELIREAQKCGIDVKAQIAQRRLASDMPESGTGDVSHRQKRATEDWNHAPEQTRELRARTVRTSSSMAAPARARLEIEYLDEDRKIRCQMCRLPMPFNKRDGKPYFECVQIFCNMSREAPDQYLALCPNCQAKYDEWIRKFNPNACRLRQTIVGHQIPADQGSVKITLPDEGSVDCPNSPLAGKSLYFTQKHFADIQAVLKAEEQSVE